MTQTSHSFRFAHKQKNKNTTKETASSVSQTRPFFPYSSVHLALNITFSFRLVGGRRGFGQACWTLNLQHWPLLWNQSDTCHPRFFTWHFFCHYCPACVTATHTTFNPNPASLTHQPKLNSPRMDKFIHLFIGKTTMTMWRVVKNQD